MATKPKAPTPVITPAPVVAPASPASVHPQSITGVSIAPDRALFDTPLADLRPGEVVLVEPGIIRPEHGVPMTFERPSAAPIPGNMVVKIKLLSEAARVPTYGSAGAACFDLYAADTVAIAPGRAATVKTDVAFEVPEGYALNVYSRSGHGYKNGLRLVNSVGKVDSDYRGEVVARLHNDSTQPYVVALGERVAQAEIVPVPRIEFVVVDELSATARGTGGFGSTGK
ncbi:MAG: dUTP diphosphatase [Hydrogenophaga sp.]|nr:dUTP diphosphatase [Hydrogenophaga sp.]